MALSTNSVFHFTKNIDSVKSIITSSFRIKYCSETVEYKKRKISYAVPMASFCDIPLSQVNSHIKKYGGYGIGLLKKWAKRKGLNPVLYLEKDATILSELIRDKFENSNDIVQEFLRYTKNYEGVLKRDGKIIQKSYRFYDEREWRYCPTERKMNGPTKIIHDNDYYLNNKDQINRSINHLHLDFKLSDISYIIVQDDTEVLDIIKHLEEHLKKEENQDYVKILTSKIMTSKQIRTDF